MKTVLQNMSSREKLKYICSCLEKGTTREELAVNLGYKTYKSMDIFVRRQGYTWDRKFKRYLLPGTLNDKGYKQMIPPIKGKVGEVIAFFTKGNLDAKEIAQQTGFSSHREMAIYMKTSGYLWDPDIGNYRLGRTCPESVNPGKTLDTEIKEHRENEEVVEGTRKIEEAERTEKTGMIHTIEAVGKMEKTEMAELVELIINEEKLFPTRSVGKNQLDVKQPWINERYQDLFEYLLQKEAILRQLLEQKNEMESEGILPHYTVPGPFVRKSVHITYQLDQLVRDFSKEKNIGQRELFEAALVEFFQKYGYKQEINKLLKQR